MNKQNYNPTGGKTYHFPFLDGIRGIAALYVVFYHVIANGSSIPGGGPAFLAVFRFGHEAVVIFIVLSGFVLSLPLIHLAYKKFPDGLPGFFKRRALRILPAYYMALLAYPLFILSVELMKKLTGEGLDFTRLKHLFFNFNMLSHLFLLQNLKPEWNSAPEYNLVLWSMATEWWVYVIFAILLVPVWRKMGIFAALGLSVVLGLVPLAFHLSGGQTITGYPHLVGGFGLGMFTAADLSNRNEPLRFSAQRKRFLWSAAAAFGLFVLVLIAQPAIRDDAYLSAIPDLLLSVVVAGLIFMFASIRLGQSTSGVLSTLFLKIFESRPAAFFGKISYSLYLTHLIFFSMIGVILNLAPVRERVHLTVEPLAVRFFVILPAIVLAAYGFHLLFEKPFLRKRKTDPAPARAAASPTPGSM